MWQTTWPIWRTMTRRPTNASSRSSSNTELQRKGWIQSKNLHIFFKLFFFQVGRYVQEGTRGHPRGPVPQEEGAKEAEGTKAMDRQKADIARAQTPRGQQEGRKTIFKFSKNFLTFFQAYLLHLKGQQEAQEAAMASWILTTNPWKVYQKDGNVIIFVGKLFCFELIKLLLMFPKRWKKKLITKILFNLTISQFVFFLWN